MTLGIHFNEGIADILTALDESNQMSTDLALTFGANRRDIDLVRYTYQSALAHIGRAFGLQQTELVVILKGEVVYQERQIREAENEGLADLHGDGSGNFDGGGHRDNG